MYCQLLFFLNLFGTFLLPNRYVQKPIHTPSYGQHKIVVYRHYDHTFVYFFVSNNRIN